MKKCKETFRKREFSLIRKQRPPADTVEIEISPDGEQISGWCADLKRVGLLECVKDCDTCWCG